MKNRGKLKKMDVRKIVPKSAKRGAIPGTIAYVGKPRTEGIKIELIEYSETTITEVSVEKP